MNRRALHVPAVVLAATVLLPACASDRTRSGLFEPYRISIPQGNYVTLAQLEQVRFVLGTPLVADVFHPDRWDYVFRFQHANGEADLRHASVFFESDRVKRVTQVDLPARDDPNDPALPGARARRAQK